MYLLMHISLWNQFWLRKFVTINLFSIDVLAMPWGNGKLPISSHAKDQWRKKNTWMITWSLIPYIHNLYQNVHGDFKEGWFETTEMLLE